MNFFKKSLRVGKRDSMKKIILAVLGLVVATAGGGYAYLELRSPKSAPAADIKVEMTQERIARGEYIFERLANCNMCHSERDSSKFAAPVLPGRSGAGFVFPKDADFPGKIVASNLTPDKETGLGGWTDGEKIRAIREGIGRDGRALFPLMPYDEYRNMSDEDIYSLIAYLNSLLPIHNTLPQTKLNFPVNLLIKSVPQPVFTPVSKPDKGSSIKYGEYLVQLGSCKQCHTEVVDGQFPQDKLFAGGHLFRYGGMMVRSSNITPEMETGIGSWGEQRFVEKFKGYANFTAENTPSMNQSNFTLMPWHGMSKLEEDDLRAIYRFLRTVKPVRNAVDPHKPEIQVE